MKSSSCGCATPIPSPSQCRNPPTIPRSVPGLGFGSEKTSTSPRWMSRHVEAHPADEDPVAVPQRRLHRRRRDEERLDQERLDDDRDHERDQEQHGQLVPGGPAPRRVAGGPCDRRLAAALGGSLADVGRRLLDVGRRLDGRRLARPVVGHGLGLGRLLRLGGGLGVGGRRLLGGRIHGLAGGDITLESLVSLDLDGTGRGRRIGRDDRRRPRRPRRPRRRRPRATPPPSRRASRRRSDAP